MLSFIVLILVINLNKKINILNEKLARIENNMKNNEEK